MEKWSESKIAQPVALQLLFDCRYVAAATGSLVDQKFQNIQQELEQLVKIQIQLFIFIFFNNNIHHGRENSLFFHTYFLLNPSKPGPCKFLPFL